MMAIGHRVVDKLIRLVQAKGIVAVPDSQGGTESIH